MSLTNILKPPPLFPHKLKKTANEEKFIKFMAMLKQLSMNAPLVEELEHMLESAKFR